MIGDEVIRTQVISSYRYKVYGEFTSNAPVYNAKHVPDIPQQKLSGATQQAPVEWFREFTQNAPKQCKDVTDIYQQKF